MISVPDVLAIAGAIALLVGVWGGLKIREVEIPSASPTVRIIMGIVGLALIGVSIWLYSPPINAQQPKEAAIPANGLEEELAKANIVLTEVPDKSSQVRQWLIRDLQYQSMAQSILTALEGKRVINPIPLDVITSKYRVSLGGNEGTNFSPDQYKDIEKTKSAIFDTWKERHNGFSQKSFDEITEIK
jgi:hypothetical protein